MSSQLLIRQAEIKDQNNLEYFLNYEFYVHQHLDWRSALDWLGHPSFFVATYEHEIVACLVAPGEVHGVAWIRLFACSALYSQEKLWDQLFEAFILNNRTNIQETVALGINKWFVDLLLKKSFTIHQNIIVFEWSQSKALDLSINKNISIQKAELKDLPEIIELDSKCFAPIWQLPLNSMKEAYFQAGYITKATLEGKIIGYQLCTESLSSAHLARLAVDPGFQGKKIGSTLVNDLLNHYRSRGISHISVNTQDDNFSSKTLYAKSGFVQSQEMYPVLIQTI